MPERYGSKAARKMRCDGSVHTEVIFPSPRNRLSKFYARLQPGVAYRSRAGDCSSGEAPPQ